MNKPNITKVSYGRTISTKSYESVRIDLEAEVGRGERYEEVLEALKREMKIHECDILRGNK